MPSLSARIYSVVFKRSSTYFLAIAAGVFLFERTADGLADKVFDEINKGKQWKDIKDLYAAKQEE
jgi:hypothetical protein